MSINKIAFLVWSPDISGGTNVIFEHATRMLRLGHEVTIICEEPFNAARLKWFPGAEDLNWETYKTIDDKLFDIVFATWWRTVFYLHFVKARRYAYFVQSIESRFYPEDDVVLRQLVDFTYTLPLLFVTEATWIASHLEEHFNQKAMLVRNGIRKEFFNNTLPPKSARQKGILRLLVEGPLNVSFKNTELALRLAHQSNADEVWFVTSTEIGSYPRVDKLFSRVPISEIGSIYASCDVLLKLSTVEGMFGPPLEIYHCGGTSISYDVSGYDEYIQNEVNGLVSFKRTDEEVVSFINRLKANPDELNRLKINAAKTASQWPDWTYSSAEFLEACVKLIISEKTIPTDELKLKTTQAWQVYENHIEKTGQKTAVIIGSGSFKARLRARVISHLHMNYPRVFFGLRKIKWTILVYLNSRR